MERERQVQRRLYMILNYGKHHVQMFVWTISDALLSYPIELKFIRIKFYIGKFSLVYDNINLNMHTWWGMIKIRMQCWMFEPVLLKRLSKSIITYIKKRKTNWIDKPMPQVMKSKMCKCIPFFFYIFIRFGHFLIYTVDYFVIKHGAIYTRKKPFTTIKSNIKQYFVIIHRSALNSDVFRSSLRCESFSWIFTFKSNRKGKRIQKHAFSHQLTHKIPLHLYADVQCTVYTFKLPGDIKWYVAFACAVQPPCRMKKPAGNYNAESTHKIMHLTKCVNLCKTQMHWNAAGWIEIPINTYSLQNVNRLNFYFLVENVNQRNFDSNANGLR